MTTGTRDTSFIFPVSRSSFVSRCTGVVSLCPGRHLYSLCPGSRSSFVSRCPGLYIHSFFSFVFLLYFFPFFFFFSLFRFLDFLVFLLVFSFFFFLVFLSRSSFISPCFPGSSFILPVSRCFVDC